MLNQISRFQVYIKQTFDIMNNKFVTDKKIYLSSINFMIYNDNSSPIFSFILFKIFNMYIFK